MIGANSHRQKNYKKPWIAFANQLVISPNEIRRDDRQEM